MKNKIFHNFSLRELISDSMHIEHKPMIITSYKPNTQSFINISGNSSVKDNTSRNANQLQAMFQAKGKAKEKGKRPTQRSGMGFRALRRGLRVGGRK